LIQSIHFKIRRWDYNENSPKTNVHTDCDLLVHPLRSSVNQDAKAEGLVFVWLLVITGEGIEMLYYSTEEFFVIPDRIITDAQLADIISNSYDKASNELALRNKVIGLDVALPDIGTLPLSIKEIREVLDM
jgi:hypothetical protein